MTWAVAQDPGTRITARTFVDELTEAIAAEETATATATRQLERRIRPFTSSSSSRERTNRTS